ncbi:hypothetical protein EDC04DRAFT_2894530 [Pisolithus marmoratus]|nr:hypothetical protein EDC04DRAFT_2894530 [Pisolithus marmoratus]
MEQDLQEHNAHENEADGYLVGDILDELRADDGTTQEDLQWAISYEHIETNTMVQNFHKSPKHKVALSKLRIIFETGASQKAISQLMHCQSIKVDDTFLHDHDDANLVWWAMDHHLDLMILVMEAVGLHAILPTVDSDPTYTSPIDFDKTPTNFFAKGMLFPSINMSSVDALLARGLAAVCNRLLSQMQNIWPNNDHAALVAWSPATSTNWRAEEPNIPRSGYDCDDEPLEGYDGDVLQDDPEEAFYLPGHQPQERSNMEPEDNGHDEEFDDSVHGQQDRHINWDDDNDMQSDGLDLVIHPDGKIWVPKLSATLQDILLNLTNAK